MVMSIVCAALTLVSVDVQTIRADVSFLASDRLAGRLEFLLKLPGLGLQGRWVGIHGKGAHEGA